MTNEDIICISSIDWDFIWQGHQEIMSNLADSGNRVLFIENTGVRPPNLRDIPRLQKRIHNWFHSVKGIRQIKKNLYVYSPIILPFPYSRIARIINRYFLISSLNKWIRSISFSNPIIWTFLPTALVLDVIDSVNSKLVVYYCIDNFSASSSFAKKIKKTEDILLKRADIVFVTAKNLHDRCAKFNKNVHTFPFGVNIETYRSKNGKNHPVPADIAAIKHPIVGYIGGVHKWIDFDLVRFLAENNPDKSFVFVGPIQANVSVLKGLSNVYFLGQKRYEELPLYVSAFDVCIIPYLITEYTKNVYPTKLNEYLSLGKGVISTRLPEVEAYNERNGNIVYVGNTGKEISDLINAALSGAQNKAIHQMRVDTAIREGSWEFKIKNMSELIDGQLKDREKERSIRWKDDLLKFYRKSRLKAIPVLGGLLIAYMILFYTPFLWFAAKPLKVSSLLEKSDAIVVLAGGVGESGKAGQGYEERVEYAVDLMKKGYAPVIIFSSGYKYAIKETAIMRALAISLGVPDNAILLEDKSTNTFENIEFSKETLLAHHWKKAIIISSPYHMLRVSLVSKKIAPEIKFIYSPMPHSLFYGDEKTIRPKHLSAIFHEYIGIIYYYLKGYI